MIPPFNEKNTFLQPNSVLDIGQKHDERVMQ